MVSQEYSDIKNQVDAVIYFIQQLDIEMLDILLDPRRTYQDFEKVIFIDKLGIVFDEFRKSGDTYLNCLDGFCNSKSCSYKCRGFSFIGNTSDNYIDIIIKIKSDAIIDIFQCSNFQNMNYTQIKSNQIIIDKS